MSRRRGFTLIELMIVVAVIAIIAAIAYPSYTHYVTRTQRTAAESCLAAMAQSMERYYTEHLSYKDADLPKLDCNRSGQTGRNYVYSFATRSATEYKIKAKPNRTTQCGTLALDQSGKRYSSKGSVSDCW